MLNKLFSLAMPHGLQGLNSSTKPKLLIVKVPSLKHWNAREFPLTFFFFDGMSASFLILLSVHLA